MKVNELEVAYKAEVCSTKCSRGCVGKDCFCGSYTRETHEVDEAKTYPLCTDALGCRDACNAHADCLFFTFDPERSMCWLLKSCGSTVAAEGWQTWTREKDKQACTTDSDF